MIGPRRTREDEAYRKIVYAGTDVYKNKLGIPDKVGLEDAERRMTSRRAKQRFPRSAHFRDYAGFRAMHRHLFQDVYTWAG